MEILQTIQNLDVRTKVVEAINQAVQIRWTIEQGKGDIKDIADSLKEDHDIKPAEFTKVVETIFKANLAEQKAKLGDLEAIIDLVSGDVQDIL